MKKTNLFIKRLIDIFCSGVGVIIISPILIIIALLIKLNSKGPVLFKQERIGLYGKVFVIFKFRTMVVGAEQLGDGLSINTSTDSRITKIGKFLRSTSLDEFPQLFNVLKGDMSLVGPRPPVTYFPYKGINDYPDWAKNRFNMRPGITGLAQVSVRNSVSWDERIKIDNKYIQNFNFYLDIKILLKTFYKLFKSENIYMEQQVKDKHKKA